VKKAVLMGPFVGEFFWEAFRFAPLLPRMIAKEYKNQDIKYIILTREERFDLYGSYADILVPLRINGDYNKMIPECFRLIGFPPDKVKQVANKFYNKYSEKYEIVKHIYPDVRKGRFVDKHQFPQNKMIFKFKPRNENYKLVEKYLPKSEKPLVIIAARLRKGFKRNWKHWPVFYDMLWNDVELMRSFNFIICGKNGECVHDSKNRFMDMKYIKPGKESSSAGILLVILQKAFFTVGSQSAIPNLSLLYGVEVLEFGCQKRYHTITYNIKKTPVTFIENRKYNIEPERFFRMFRKTLLRKRRNLNAK